MVCGAESAMLWDTGVLTMPELYAVNLTSLMKVKHK